MRISCACNAAQSARATTRIHATRIHATRPCYSTSYGKSVYSLICPGSLGHKTASHFARLQTQFGALECPVICSHGDHTQINMS